MRRSWGKEPFPLSQISSRLPGQVTARDNQLIIVIFVSFLKQNMDYLHIITQSTYFCSDQPLKYLGVLRNICKIRNFGKISMGEDQFTRAHICKIQRFPKKNEGVGARCDTYLQILKILLKFRQDRVYLQGVKISKNDVDQINKKILTLKKFPEVAFFFPR